MLAGDLGPFLGQSYGDTSHKRYPTPRTPRNPCSKSVYKKSPKPKTPKALNPKTPKP